MADVARLFDEWAAALARGEQPDPLPFLREAGAAGDELARMMDGYLRARPRADPDPERVELARAWIRREAPLVQLRARRGLRRAEVVDAVVAEFGLGDERRPVVTRYYHQLEAGALDPSRLSRPLLDLLARVLRVPAASILAWRPRPLDVAPAYRLPRVALAEEPLLAAASAPREPVEDDEQVRALFISDR
jgi:hypothetical protein